MVEIRRAEPGEHQVVGDTLADAFSEDPLFAWMIGTERPLEPRLQRFFGALVGATMRRDHLVFRTDDGAGAAVWKAPDDWKMRPVDMVRTAPAMIGAFGTRLPRMLKALSVIERAHPEEPHYYLEMLGTRCDVQGKGIGSAVIGDGLARCDEEGLPAYLESSNPKNVPFYARHGFEVVQELSCGPGAPVTTAMWREPRDP